MRCDRPNESERILYLTIAVTPELLLYWHGSRANLP
jgi:hypothetical protein